MQEVIGSTPIISTEKTPHRNPVGRFCYMHQLARASRLAVGKVIGSTPIIYSVRAEFSLIFFFAKQSIQVIV
jgi:hypothetical protein